MCIWDQQPDESNAAYARFLAYRNLGPSRSLERAYQATKGNAGQPAPGQWTRDSERFNWVERATAWDVALLLQQGEVAATAYVAAVKKHAFNVLDALESGIKPETFADVTKAIELLAKLFPGEAIGHIIAERKKRRERAE